ncbi:MAG: leucine-rich repeat domain-containing protein [Clostridiales bacterium]|nr:leucine-rich repeat domain-containing protein [Clostridiales bacterium]
MGKCKLKIVSMVLTVIIVFSLFPATVALAGTRASGTCGSNLNWTLSDTGTLTISGSGNMDNWISESRVPWREYRSSIKSVVFSGNITSIGKYSFFQCSNLTSIKIPESVTLIDKFAFKECTNLKSVNIPSGVTAINASVFYQCSSLTNITIPSNVTMIGSSAFEYCTNLNNITIPSKVTEIGSYAFSNCNSFTNITIPSGVVTIYQSIFNNCKNLKTVSIPNSVTSMGYYVFTGCESLTDIYFAGTREKFTKFLCYSSIDKSVNIHYGSTAPVSITTQPKDYSGAVGSAASFSVTASGTGLSYQWQVYSNGVWSNSNATGSNTNKISFNVTNSHNGKKYRCVVTDKNGQKVTSNAASITVVASSITITKQPSNYTGGVGNTASFSVTAQGTGLSYIWQVYSNGAWRNSGATGAKTSKISFKVSNDHNGMKYRCVIKDANGQKVVTDVVSVKVVAAPSITRQPSDYSGSVGSQASFSIAASGSGLTYQWQMYTNGAWKNSGATGAKTSKITFNVTNSHSGMKYRCIVKDSYGQKVVSNTAVVRVI